MLALILKIAFIFSPLDLGNCKQPSGQRNNAETCKYYYKLAGWGFFVLLVAAQLFTGTVCNSVVLYAREPRGCPKFWDWLCSIYITSFTLGSSKLRFYCVAFPLFEIF